MVFVAVNRVGISSQLLGVDCSAFALTEGSISADHGCEGGVTHCAPTNARIAGSKCDVMPLSRLAPVPTAEGKVLVARMWVL